jgi:hypothetical protein
MYTNVNTVVTNEEVLGSDFSQMTASHHPLKMLQVRMKLFFLAQILPRFWQPMS